METAKLIADGRGQAVRLPKSCCFEGFEGFEGFESTEVLIKRVGDAVTLLPVRHPWKTLIDSLGQFEPGFRIERAQPAHQRKRKRKALPA